MNVVRIIALSLLVAAGGSLAATKSNSSKKQPPPQSAPKPLVTEADRPKSCADHCKLMEKVMLEPCQKGANGNKQAQQQCGKQAKQVIEACNGSCRDKGRLDKQYIMERIKPPAGYKVPQGAGAQGGKEAQDAQ